MFAFPANQARKADMTDRFSPQFVHCFVLSIFCTGWLSLGIPAHAASAPENSPALPHHLPAETPDTRAASTLPSPAPPTPQPSSPNPDDLRPLGPASSSASPASGAASSASVWQSWSWLIQTLAALALVLSLIFLLRFLLSRASAATPWLTPTSSRGIDLLARRCLAPRHYILILRLGHRLLVVGQSPAGLHPLASIRHPDEIAAVLSAISSNRPGSSTADFHHTLAQLTRTWPDQDDQSDSTEIHTDRARDSLRALLSRLRLLGQQEPHS